MARPSSDPIGLQVTRTAKVLNRAFEQQLAAAGGSLPAWLILVSLKGGQATMQRELADAVGIEGPTLTHHLHALEDAGIVRRERDRGDRRVQRVALTDAGEAMFQQLLGAVAAFDRSLRSGLRAAEVAQLGDLLARLRANATTAVSA